MEEEAYAFKVDLEERGIQKDRLLDIDDVSNKKGKTMKET